MARVKLVWCSILKDANKIIRNNRKYLAAASTLRSCNYVSRTYSLQIPYKLFRTQFTTLSILKIKMNLSCALRKVRVVIKDWKQNMFNLREGINSQSTSRFIHFRPDWLSKQKKKVLSSSIFGLMNDSHSQEKYHYKGMLLI
jgi:hypothetical protein